MIVGEKEREEEGEGGERERERERERGHRVNCRYTRPDVYINLNE